MFILTLPTCMTFFTVVSSLNFLGKGPMAQFYWKDLSKYFSQKAATDNGPTSQVMVVEMHYDCKGRLLYQEVSKLEIQTGVFRVPGEEDILLKTIHEILEPLPKDFGKEIKAASQIKSVDDKDSLTKAQASGVYESLKSRIRSTTKDPIIQSVAQTTLKPKVTKTTLRPPMEHDIIAGPVLEDIGPDKIIEVPIRSCQVGKNEDPNGKCREKYP